MNGAKEVEGLGRHSGGVLNGDMKLEQKRDLAQHVVTGTYMRLECVVSGAGLKDGKTKDVNKSKEQKRRTSERLLLCFLLH